jgi:hypothetical protein
VSGLIGPGDVLTGASRTAKVLPPTSTYHPTPSFHASRLALNYVSSASWLGLINVKPCLIKGERSCDRLVREVDLEAGQPADERAVEREALNIFDAEGGACVVEYFDERGRSYVTVFAGPQAAKRARDYYDALKAGLLVTIRDTSFLQ